MYYKVTDLRNDPNYIRYYINWTRFLATGLGPMAALVFFNYSIFRGIRSAHCLLLRCRIQVILVIWQVSWVNTKVVSNIHTDSDNPAWRGSVADGMINWVNG